MHYLDNAATTRVLPAVADAAGGAMLQTWGNPSSLYRMGLAAEQLVAAARGEVARALSCRPEQVFFTSGGTEANNLALQGAVRARRVRAAHVVTTGYEHPSVADALALLEKQGEACVTAVSPGPNGTVEVERLVDAVTPDTVLLAAMQVNNETGAVLDVARLARAVKQKNPRCFVHVDGVQAFCKLPVALSQTAVDSCAVSGHKLHAPKGVGALYLRGGKAAHLLPLFGGGGQEQNIRPGTENVPFIAAFGKAVQLASLGREGEQAQIARLRQRLLEGLAALGGVTVHAPAGGYAGIVMFSLPRGFRSQVMLHFLDEGHGVCVSGGSACGGGAASRTLQAMGLPGALIDTALRASFCGENTAEDVDALLCGLREGMRRLARA